MHALKRFLGWQISNELSTAKFSQLACYASAIGFFALATWKIARLQVTEADLFFGILQVLAVFLLVICVGTLVRIHAELTKNNNSQ